MRETVLCPFHKDTTPSLVLYETYGHCFVCHAHPRVDSLNLPGERKHVKKEKEDIQKTLTYINGLPRKLIRGLYLPVDDQGYYLVWPDNNYYKLRYWSGKLRYKGPQGVRPPLYKTGIRSSHLAVIEGEMNAASIATCNTRFSIVSPGSATNFQSHMKTYLTYKKVTLILDNDPAGQANGLLTKEALLKLGIDTRLVLVDKDFNDMLVDGTLSAYVNNLRGFNV